MNNIGETVFNVIESSLQSERYLHFSFRWSYNLTSDDTGTAVYFDFIHVDKTEPCPQNGAKN